MEWDESCNGEPLSKYSDIVDYLVNDTFDNEIKDDVRQELLTHLNKLLLKKPNARNLKNYLFIALKNKRTKVIEKSNKNKTVSLNRKIGNSNNELIDSFEDINSIQYDNELKVDLEKALKTLTPKEKFIINQYYYENKTMKEIGEILKQSQQNISYQHNKILDKLENILK